MRMHTEWCPSAVWQTDGKMTANVLNFDTCHSIALEKMRTHTLSPALPPFSILLSVLLSPLASTPSFSRLSPFLPLTHPLAFSHLLSPPFPPLAFSLIYWGLFDYRVILLREMGYWYLIWCECCLERQQRRHMDQTSGLKRTEDHQ